jgi:hypothetical protein
MRCPGRRDTLGWRADTRLSFIGPLLKRREFIVSQKVKFRQPKGPFPLRRWFVLTKLELSISPRSHAGVWVAVQHHLAAAAFPSRLKLRVEIVRRTIDAWNQHDPEIPLEQFLAPEIEWEPASPAAVERSVYRGYDEVTSALAALWETWEVFRFDESDIRDLGDSLVWLGRVHMKGSASQVELDQEFGIHFLLHDGKVVRAKAFPSEKHALQAAGLRE